MLLTLWCRRLRQCHHDAAMVDSMSGVYVLAALLMSVVGRPACVDDAVLQVQQVVCVGPILLGGFE